MFSLFHSYSPFLNKIIRHYPEFAAELNASTVQEIWEELKQGLEHYIPATVNDLMQEMRIAKSKAALLIAASDVNHWWSLEQVTLALSELAEICVRLTLSFLLLQLHRKGDIIARNPEHPAQDSGIFVLGMGKLGAWELNYSSDIDLIIFYESERVRYYGNDSMQRCLSRLAQEMVRILQERTAAGYVFRVDLRLRPDPASTPAAMSVAGAITCLLYTSPSPRD